MRTAGRISSKDFANSLVPEVSEVILGQPRKNPNINEVVAATFPLCGLVLAPGSAWRAQQSPDSGFSSNDGGSDQDISAPRANSDNAAVRPATTLTFAERVKIYEKSFKEPEPLIGPVWGAGVGQLRTTPPEWGSGPDGFGIRVASGFGRSVISRTIALGVASADHEDSRFTPSGESGIWRRTCHAIVGTFVSRTSSGGSMPAFSRFAGAYGAGFMANYWEPPSQNSTSHALERGFPALASSVSWHIFEESWPDIRKTFHHRHEQLRERGGEVELRVLLPGARRKESNG